MPESAGREPVQGIDEGSRWPQPGNVHGAEQFPEFCLHRDNFDSGRHTASSPSTPTASSASSPSSSRSSTFSTFSTASATLSLLSLSSSPEAKKSKQHPHPRHHQPRQQEEQQQEHPWAASTSSPTPRSRRDKKALHAARLQRSASNSITGVVIPLGINNNNNNTKPLPTTTKARRFTQRSSSSPADALAAVEPPHDQGLARMAFAEQQRWITVQQKTFTKWYAATIMIQPALVLLFFIFFSLLILRVADNAVCPG